jgi:hypothetical protein
VLWESANHHGWIPLDLIKGATFNEKRGPDAFPSVPNQFSSHSGFERGAHEDHLYIAQSRLRRRPIGEAHFRYSDPAACVARQPR